MILSVSFRNYKCTCVNDFFPSDFAISQKIFNGRLLSNQHILTWKDNKDIVSVKYKWQNTMYSLSQIQVCEFYICIGQKRFGKICITLLNMFFFLRGVGAWVLEGIIGALLSLFHFILFEVYISMYYFYIIRIFRKYFTDLKA